MRVKTSESDPIRVDFLDEQPWRGRLGITFAPGKKNDSYDLHRWDRDLDLDLIRMKEVYGVEVVVTVLEQDEMEWMEIDELGDEVRERGMEWMWFPIEDLDAPPGERFEEFMGLAREMLGRLDGGKVVAVHCRGGLGRSGMVAACLLSLRGMTPAAAIRCVRRARGEGAVEMEVQEEFVEDVHSVGLDEG
jgi:protein-tyrosine phosphatase